MLATLTRQRDLPAPDPCSCSTRACHLIRNRALVTRLVGRQWKLLLGTQRAGDSFNGPTYPNASTPSAGGGDTDLHCNATGCQ